MEKLMHEYLYEGMKPDLHVKLTKSDLTILNNINGVGDHIRPLMQFIKSNKLYWNHNCFTITGQKCFISLFHKLGLEISHEDVSTGFNT